MASVDDHAPHAPGPLKRLAGAIARHKAMRGAVLGAILAVAVAILIGKAADYSALTDALHEANGHWFPLLLGSFVVATLGYIGAYRGTARVLQGPRLPFWLTTRAWVRPWSRRRSAVSGWRTGRSAAPASATTPRSRA
jgi:hypothetical protein